MAGNGEQELTVVTQRQEGIFTITTWSDGRKIFSVSGDKGKGCRFQDSRLARSELVNKA
jgi:hypothetical protein